MVLRHQACIVPLVLLAVGLGPSTGRVLPRWALGSSSGRLGQAAERASGGSVSQRTALRLGEGGHSCLVTDGARTRRGAWGLPVVRNSVPVVQLIHRASAEMRYCCSALVVGRPCLMYAYNRPDQAREARVKAPSEPRRVPGYMFFSIGCHTIASAVRQSAEEEHDSCRICYERSQHAIYARGAYMCLTGRPWYNTPSPCTPTRVAASAVSQKCCAKSGRCTG